MASLSLVSGDKQKKARKRDKKRSVAGVLALVFVGWFFLQWFLVGTVDQQQKRNKVPDAPRDLKAETTSTSTRKVPSSADDTTEFHIVFSTDCSGYQHWQGILLYYSAVRVSQPGTITRIASGCTPEQQQAIAAEWSRLDPTGKRFQVHFAPSTALEHEKYKYSNKPGGILHWLQHHTPKLDRNAVVCLLDPDMILLKPLTAQLVDPFWKTRAHGRNQVEYFNPTTGMAQLLRVKSLVNDIDDNLPARVTTGFPAGQHFGIGGAWVQGESPSAKPAWKNFSKAYVCGNGRVCTTTSSADASQRYAVGPVYMATVADWEPIAATWWEFVPRVHEQYTFLLAEMYSLTMAVANLQIPFSLFSSYMVTGADVGSPTEAWSWIDDIFAKNNNKDPLQVVCPDIVDKDQPPPLPLPTANNMPLPNTLHYCQRYKMDFDDNSNNNKQSFLFSKRKMPHTVFSCDNNDAPVPFDMQELIRLAKDKQQSSEWTTIEKRTLFAFCQLVPLLDWARKMYREQACV